jgi:hypothetical protein
MSNLLSQSKSIFDSQPKDMPELPFEYTSTLMNTKPLDSPEIEKIMKKNPITPQGRVAVIEGTLSRLQKLGRTAEFLVSDRPIREDPDHGAGVPLAEELPDQHR